MSDYSEPLDDIGDLMTVKDWLSCVADGGFIDYDGFGHPVRDGLMDGTIDIWPSQADMVPQDATHIMWYNR